MTRCFLQGARAAQHLHCSHDSYHVALFAAFHRTHRVQHWRSPQHCWTGPEAISRRVRKSKHHVGNHPRARLPQDSCSKGCALRPQCTWRTSPIARSWAAQAGWSSSTTPRSRRRRRKCNLGGAAGPHEENTRQHLTQCTVHRACIEICKLPPLPQDHRWPQDQGHGGG